MCLWYDYFFTIYIMQLSRVVFNVIKFEENIIQNMAYKQYLKL